MPLAPGLTLSDPPRNSTSGIGARTMRGPISAYFAGRRSCQTLGGSTTWSSTEMIIGRGSDMGIERSPHLTGRQKTDRVTVGRATLDIFGFPGTINGYVDSFERHRRRSLLPTRRPPRPTLLCRHPNLT